MIRVEMKGLFAQEGAGFIQSCGKHRTAGHISLKATHAQESFDELLKRKMVFMEIFALYVVIR